ncbi:COR domain-containing protein [Prosthecobacter debontii]|nr:COR domain-containing protein [Prosthecobacter debontii]
MPSASPKAILDYYFAQQTQGTEPMQEVRLLMVGRGRVGKTSLLKALRDKPHDRNEQETPGITVLPLPVNCPQGEATAHTWDFGGQEFLHGTHQIFLSERCVYVLVLEGRDGNWELETDYWLRFIQSFGGDSPVLVVLNKYASHPFSVDRFRLQERCPQIVGFVETDAKTRLGIQELRTSLEKTVDQMEHVWAGVPKKWHRIKEELGQTEESYLDYKDYQKLCTRHDVPEEDQQDSLAQNLHRLGIALNFRDHHRLKHTSVLKPQWVTEGIYGLLRYAQKQDCCGVLEKSWLAKALLAKDYPAEKHGFVLELMEKFEVAFALPTTKDAEPTRWLIPELLPEVQPAAFMEFRGKDVKRLRYTYPEALPPGLLPRLIVRTHELSQPHPEWRWRSGVVLVWNGCQALVRLDRSQRQTTVEVIGGPDEQRQGLFDIIRSHLVTLHGKVPAVEEVQAVNDPEKWVAMQDLRLAERDEDDTMKITVGEGAEAKRIKLPVVETLDTVESKESRIATGPEPEKRMQLFISYAHANEKEIAPIKPHLTLLSQRGYIQVWQDRDLIAGECWETGILDALNKADIVLLFYTTAARVSKFIQETELRIALERSDKNECSVIWVPLERSDLDTTHALESQLKKLQCATRDAKCIFHFDHPSTAWVEVEGSIRKAVEKRRKM